MPAIRLLLHSFILAGAAMVEGPDSDRAMDQDIKRRSRFVAELGRRLDVAMREGRFANLHAVVLTDGEEPLFERHFDGSDERWGISLGTVNFAFDTLHDLRSVTKSVVGLLYGIALGDGKVPSPDQSMIGGLPRYAGLAGDAALAGITVANDLRVIPEDWIEASLTAHTDVDEDFAYGYHW